MADTETQEQPKVKDAAGKELPENVQAAAGTNTALDADLEAAKRAKEDVVKDKYVGGQGLKNVVEAVDPTKVKGVGSTSALRPGDRVNVTLSTDRVVEANVLAVHPGTEANEAAGIEAKEPSVDVKAFTGNPDRGGWEELFGIPLTQISHDVSYR